MLVARFGEHIIGRDAYYHYVKQAPVMLDMFRWGTLELFEGASSTFTIKNLLRHYAC